MALAEVNVSMWNCRSVFYNTGYSVQMLTDCLYALGSFIQLNIDSNALKFFNIEAIKQIRNFKNEAKG